jgi:predicted SAM-dependent methyltransferase
MVENKKLRLHLGCGSNILKGYVNIDKYIDKIGIRQYDIIKLPYLDGEVDEIFHQHVIEHLDFHEEKKAFEEWYRILIPGGLLHFDVLDFEWLCQKFLNANDNWKQFYNTEDHNYFGNGYNINERWSVLAAHFYGNQAGNGQIHKNMYTEKKLYRILESYNYKNIYIEKFNYDKFEELQCLRVRANK